MTARWQRYIEEIMAKRGVVRTYKTVGEWCFGLGQIHAKADALTEPLP